MKSLHNDLVEYLKTHKDRCVYAILTKDERKMKILCLDS